MHWPLAFDRLHTREFLGVGNNRRVPKERHKLAPDPGSRRRTRDGSQEGVRIETALEAMGDFQGPVVEVVKADLAKAR